MLDQNQRSRRPSRAAGFTLIELMVVVAIVGILVGIALPSYHEAVRKGRRGQAKSDLIELTQWLERHRTVQNTYVTSPGTIPITQSPRSGDAYYTIEVGNQTGTTFTATATPVTGTAQADDRCGTLTINQAGTKWHSAGTVEQCQFGTVGP